jgi:uncharacterized protein (DUF433 family)
MSLRDQVERGIQSVRVEVSMIQRNKQPDHPLVEERPGVNGGYPVIAMTRIGVRLIVQAFQETGDLDETAEAYPQLSREQVQAALAFYHDFPARVDEDIERNEKALRAIRSRV